MVHAGYSQQNISKQVVEAMNTASTADIKADITYLADDKLKGRQPGTEGFKMAADYVSAKLKSYHVEPAGENGSWLQQVRLRKSVTTDGSISISKDNQVHNLAYGTDAVIFPDPVKKDNKVEGDIVFAGFGISDAGLNYDDYKGLNVDGKIVLVLRGAPESFPSSVASHSMDLITIQKNAAAHGAAGVIVGISNPAAHLPNLTRGIFSVTDEKGNIVVSRSYSSDKIKLLAVVNADVFKELTAGKNAEEIISGLKAGKEQSFATSYRVKASYQSAWQDINSFNVVGKIPGSDPKLRNEYVVHSAHLDHLGIGTPVQGDSIYNGAHDNASGVASLLQIAKIYSNLRHKPKRSILVVMVTAEELGELGSGYFAHHPTVPIKNIVADVNTDMPTIIAPLLSVTALGAEHSSLQKQVDEAAAQLDITVEPDPEPKENRFVRSDQYSFVVQGIPALHIKYGSKTTDGKNNLNEFVAQWRAKYYHKPQDDINGIFDFDAGRKYAQLNFLIGYLVANNSERPQWNKGDIFAQR